MNGEKSKWNREEKARFDKAQTLFVDDAIKPNTFRFAKTEDGKLDFTRKVTCPFCLSWLPLSKFIISTKKGYNRGLGKCPECGQGMRLKTLFALGQWTPEQYAKFVIEYPCGAFFQKVRAHFEAWKKRLYMMDWSKRFWLEYRRLNPKETSDEEQEAWDGYDKCERANR